MRSIGEVLPATFHGDVRLCDLSAGHYNILIELSGLFDLARKRNPKKKACAFCGQAYLAKKCNLTRTYVSEITTQLHKWGFIEKIFRRRENGTYRTCLYRLPKSIWRKFHGKIHHIFKPKDRVEFCRHKSDSLSTTALRSADLKPVPVGENAQRIEALAARVRERQRKPPDGG